MSYTLTLTTVINLQLIHPKYQLYIIEDDKNMLKNVFILVIILHISEA